MCIKFLLLSVIPTTQSGVGPNIDTNDTLLCLRSTRKCDDVFALTFGYHNPPAFINVRRREPFALSSSSSALGDPLWRAFINKCGCKRFLL